jgi:hypothetical protein
LDHLRHLLLSQGFPKPKAKKQNKCLIILHFERNVQVNLQKTCHSEYARVFRAFCMIILIC